MAKALDADAVDAGEDVPWQRHRVSSSSLGTLSPAPGSSREGTGCPAGNTTGITSLQAREVGRAVLLDPADTRAHLQGEIILVWEPDSLPTPKGQSYQSQSQESQLEFSAFSMRRL